MALSLALLAAGASQAAAQTSDSDHPPDTGEQAPDIPDDATAGLLPDSLGSGGAGDPPPGTEVLYPNLGSQLSALAVASAAGSDPGLGGAAGAARPPGGTNSTLSGEPLLLTMQLDGNREGVLEFLADNGVTPANVLGDYLEAYVPPELLGLLAGQTGVSRVREMPQPFKDRGEVVGAAATHHGASVWHLNGFTGDGVKVGVIDGSITPTSKDGFTGLRALLGSELPSTVVGRCYTDAGKPTSNLANCDTRGGDTHGTRVAESLMDVAPDAELYISNASTWADLHSAVVWMHGQGVKVINYSTSWSYHGAPNGTSPVTPSPLNTVKWAADNGIIWVNSAGNHATKT
ncbi:MAG: S8 family serine peptidase, partial [bacterium]|nr:S8 family serine peptidase [bacterium]